MIFQLVHPRPNVLPLSSDEVTTAGREPGFAEDVGEVPRGQVTDSFDCQGSPERSDGDHVLTDVGAGVVLGNAFDCGGHVVAGVVDHLTEIAGDRCRPGGLEGGTDGAVLQEVAVPTRMRHKAFGEA